MNLAGYIRVSTDRQEEQGGSIQEQIEQITDWAKKNGHNLTKIYEEPGISAFDEGKRPVFTSMVNEALSGESSFDAIVVRSLSRFSRDNVYRAWIKRKLQNAGIGVIYLTQPLPEDENAAYLTENMFGLIAEFQSRENSKTVIDCQKRNAREGFFNGSRPPFGYTTFATDIPARSGVKKKLVICPEEAEIVRG